jgi:hypothetical protein
MTALRLRSLQNRQQAGSAQGVVDQPQWLTPFMWFAARQLYVGTKILRRLERCVQWKAAGISDRIGDSKYC